MNVSSQPVRAIIISLGDGTIQFVRAHTCRHLLHAKASIRHPDGLGDVITVAVYYEVPWKRRFAVA